MEPAVRMMSTVALAPELRAVGLGLNGNAVAARRLDAELSARVMVFGTHHQTSSTCVANELSSNATR